MKTPLCIATERSSPVSPRANVSSRSAFTLIELLTVIAIIGILAAIIIPVVGKVRQSAQKASCASNMRQMGLAIIAFASDNKNMLPGGTTGIYGQVKARIGYGDQYQLATHLMPYFGSKAVTSGTMLTVPAMSCPASESTMNLTSHASYLLNPAVRTTKNTLARPFGKDFSSERPLRLTEIPAPSQAVGLFDLDTEIWRAVGSSSPSGVPTAAVHGNVRNFMYLDGHVKSQPLNFNPRET